MIHALMSASYESNAYVISRDREGILIDAGINPLPRLEKLDEINIEIKLLISTHCHYDHTAGNSEIVKRTGARVAMHELDAEHAENADRDYVLANLFGSYEGVDVDQRLGDGDVIDEAGVKLEVIHTPGHTEGSICLYEPESKALFSGDTLFSGGIGRTDLPGGSWDGLGNSLGRLISLHKEREVDKVYPGHGGIGSGNDIGKIYNFYFGR